MTNNQTTNHLTTEQLYDLLDNSAAASDAHLRTCSTCQLEFSDLRASLENFRLAATGLAAAEMPPLTARHDEPASTPRFAFRPFAFAASFATAAVLLVSVSLMRPRPTIRPVTDAPTVTSTQESDAELLNGIQQDLSASVPPSLAPLEVASR
jgi:anti-sigma factor RsiW